MTTLKNILFELEFPLLACVVEKGRKVSFSILIFLKKLFLCVVCNKISNSRLATINNNIYTHMFSSFEHQIHLYYNFKHFLALTTMTTTVR